MVSRISSNSESSFVGAEVAVTCLNRNSRWLISLKYLRMVIKINLTISSLIKNLRHSLPSLRANRSSSGAQDMT